MQFRFLLLTRFIVINTFLGALVLAAFGQGQASARGREGRRPVPANSGLGHTDTEVSR